MLSLIPISDANPTRRTPVVTLGLIIANIVGFIQTPGLGQTDASQEFFFRNAPIPCQLQDQCPVQLDQFGLGARSFGSFLGATLLAMFLHAGFLHIAGNMLFLWVFGNNIEDYLGHGKYLAFYILGGFAAGFAHVFTDLSSFVPAVGASGAVAAVMGAYLVLYPHARVNVLVPIFFIWTVIKMSAWIVLGLWFVYQFLIGAQSTGEVGGVAWMAHVGGFVFGVVGILVLGGRPHRRRPSWEAWRY